MIKIINATSVSPSSINAAGAFAAHTITCDLMPGPRYHVVWIEGNAGAAKKMTDLIGEIRVKLNDAVQRVFTGEELNELNGLFGLEYLAVGGLTAATEYGLPIFFAERWRKTVAAQQGTAWATGAGSVDTFKIEIDIKPYAGASAGVTVPTFKVEYEESFYLPDGKEVAADTIPIGIIEKVYNTQIPSPGSATNFGDYIQLPRSEPISQISLYDYANFIAFELKINNSTFREETKAQNERRLISAGMHPNPTKIALPWIVATDIPNTTDATSRGMIDLVPDHDDLLTSLFPVFLNGKRVLSFNFRIKSTTTAGTNLKCIYKTVGRPD